jgi:hypothetical protein
MRKTIQICSFVLVALLLGAMQVYAQTVLVPTTLSAAIGDGKVQTFIVASATGFSAGNLAVIDKEAAEIRAVSGTTITVRRGAAGTAAVAHASGALVWTTTQFATNAPSGACTRGSGEAAVLPRISIKDGVISDCLGGKWTAGVPSAAQKFRINSPEPGGTAYTALNTNGTTLGATTLYCTEVFVPASKLLTGIALLNGTTDGTDKHYVVLYDSAGKLLANSDVAGATSAGASAFQEFAFTSKFYAVGPQAYFACFQTNGTAATVRMAVTGSNDNLLTKGQTGATFGTIPALTVPTTFTTAVGPYVYLY